MANFAKGIVGIAAYIASTPNWRMSARGNFQLGRTTKVFFK